MVDKASVDQWASIGVQVIVIYLLRLLRDQVGELDRVIAGGLLSLRVILFVGDDIWDNVGDQVEMRSMGCKAKVVLEVVAMKLRDRGTSRSRGAGNRGNDHAIGGGMRGSRAQVTRGQTQARVYNMIRDEVPASNDVITGTIWLFDVEAYVLIDPGSMYSYISSKLTSKISGENSPLGYNLMVYFPMRGGVIVNSVRKGSLVRIEDVNLPVDLVVMDRKEFDVILGMDWVAQIKQWLIAIKGSDDRIFR
ncbi:UNVERIFIED_CONTAM: hypothetical protein Sradi_3642600 [Sesamum radiatum]|uniref:Gag-pol polyprotein n=1 Tax=Sesamum radiatum TaxID=300843 RepID=A0AAW2QJ22_SESRA